MIIGGLISNKIGIGNIYFDEYSNINSNILRYFTIYISKNIFHRISSHIN